MIEDAPHEMPKAARLRVQGVSKSFGSVRMLRDVDLEIRAGEVHALLGENGAGKATLIKILSGVHAFDRGDIELDGRRLSITTPAQSREAGTAVVYLRPAFPRRRQVAAAVKLSLGDVDGFPQPREAADFADVAMKRVVKVIASTYRFR